MSERTEVATIPRCACGQESIFERHGKPMCAKCQDAAHESDNSSEGGAA